MNARTKVEAETDKASFSASQIAHPSAQKRKSQSSSSSTKTNTRKRAKAQKDEPPYEVWSDAESDKEVLEQLLVDSSDETDFGVGKELLQYRPRGTRSRPGRVSSPILVD